MNNKTIAITVVVILIVAAGIGAAVVLSQKGGPNDQPGKRVGETLKEADFPAKDSRLWVYGNANEDDSIDATDVTELQKMVDGKKKATQLADANADGKIDKDDVEHLQKIIDAKADTKINVYYVDNYFKVAKVSWPVKSIATTYCSGLYTAEATGLTQKIAMVDNTIATYWAKLNSYAAAAKQMGTTDKPDYEEMIKQKINVYVPGYCDANADPLSNEKLNPVGIDVMFINTCDNEGVPYTNEYIDRSILMFGYLLQGDMEQTYEYLAWHDLIKSSVEAAVTLLDDDEKEPLIMSRNAPSYAEGGKYSITGKGNTNMIHADWAGCYVTAYHTTWLPNNYNKIEMQTVGTVLKELKTAGFDRAYWIDNEHDGLRGSYDLDETVKSWHDELVKFGDAIPAVNYMGMAREAGNSPLYVVEMVFYLNVMYPELDFDFDFEEVFDYWIENFTLETSKYIELMDIDNFFINYGTYYWD